MENQFVGVQNHAARRRRRLASGGSDPLEFVDATGRVVAVDGSVERPSAMNCQQQFSLLPRVVSPRLWKHVVTLTGVAACSVGAVWWEHRTGATGTHSITRGIVGIFILLSAQLAWGISWIRSRSEVDFQGRYHCWRWFAVTASVLAVTVLTETYTLFPDLVAATLAPMTGTINAARPALVLVTLVPIAILVPAQVLRDMSRCVTSRLFLVGAILLTIVRLMLVYNSTNVSISLLTLDLLLVLAALSVFASMLLHCRFVAFVSNAPPMRRRSNVKRTETAEDTPPGSDVAGAPSSATAQEEETEPSVIAEPPTDRPSRRRKKKGRKKAA
ncbi:MAG: hypothetical protein P8J37_05240 [Fuerstiella sp.]|nr:hypothetical protein [Fuerstiella sp.]